MISQLQEPTKSLFCYLSRPCTVSNLHPAFSILLARSKVFYSLRRIRILQKIGTFILVERALTNFYINYGSYNKNEP